MLVLTRRVDDGIVLQVPPSNQSQEILVKVTKIKGQTVRIGVEAAREVVITRSELDTISNPSRLEKPQSKKGN